MVLPTDIAQFLLMHMHANTCTYTRTHKHHHNLHVYILDHPILPYKCTISHHTEVLYQQIAGKRHQCKWQWVKIRHYTHLDEHVLWQTARYTVELFCMCMNTYRSLRDILISNANKFSEHEGLRCQPLVLMLLQNADLLCLYMLIKISSLHSCHSVAMSHYDIIIKLMFAEHGFHNCTGAYFNIPHLRHIMVICQRCIL